MLIAEELQHDDSSKEDPGQIGCEEELVYRLFETTIYEPEEIGGEGDSQHQSREASGGLDPVEL